MGTYRAAIVAKKCATQILISQGICNSNEFQVDPMVKHHLDQIIIIFNLQLKRTLSVITTLPRKS